ncbi:MAG: hypothetical protein SF066_23685 [Thermoanaerobaculia bacterium]|nr:hypothetical protein [Thermoanaerobaculia bacterium]
MQRLVVLLLATLVAVLGGLPAALEAVEARILYDNSGSMYPGYVPGGGAGSARYFHQIPEFRAWLSDFVAAQTALGVDRVSFWAATSSAGFDPGDVRELQSAVPVGRFVVDSALGRLPPPGRNTYLAESVEQVGQGFTGYLWLVTDNIVETADGSIDADIRRFFESLARAPRIASVHLFKYPFRDSVTARSTNLAVYGLQVGDPPFVAADVRASDRRLRDELRRLPRPAGRGLLFPGEEHWKLKDLAIDTVDWEIRPQLEVRFDPSGRRLFSGRQAVRLPLSGRVTSRLTQHAVVAARYQVALAGSLVPLGPEAGRVEPIPTSAFRPKSGQLDRILPPTGTVNLDVELASSEPLTVEPRGFGTWLRSALSPLRVSYRGTVAIHFTEVELQFERQELAGIFGIEAAPEVFGFRDLATLPTVQATPVPIEFALESGRGPQAALLAFLVGVAGLLGLGLRWLRRPVYYRVKVGDAPERMVPLRRFARIPIHLQGQILGALRRGPFGTHGFEPVPPTPALQVRPAGEDGQWLAQGRDGSLVGLIVQPSMPRATAPRASRNGSGTRPRGVMPSSPSTPSSAPLAGLGGRPAIPKPNKR